ncbi:MAG: PDZ domain-containing protein [Kangiellaceae bacterium]|jgi:serine protease Do|nr:PDZ domain-containing protein [Kangiellaceae bacterium]
MEVSGTVRKPYVGMSFTEHGPGGLAVVRVQPRSPAERSGIQIGDIITHINGTAVSKPQDFYELLGYEMGRVMNLKVIRGKQNIEIVIAT